jgi:hypothetical protein
VVRPSPIMWGPPRAKFWRVKKSEGISRPLQRSRVGLLEFKSGRTCLYIFTPTLPSFAFPDDPSRISNSSAPQLNPYPPRSEEEEEARRRRGEDSVTGGGSQGPAAGRESMDFRALPRRDLQALCKRNGVRANMTNAAMADALAALPTVRMPSLAHSSRHARLELDLGALVTCWIACGTADSLRAYTFCNFRLMGLGSTSRSQ